MYQRKAPSWMMLQVVGDDNIAMQRHMV